jgi:hypothetical protein
MDAAVLRVSDILEKEIIGGPVMVEIRGSFVYGRQFHSEECRIDRPFLTQQRNRNFDTLRRCPIYFSNGSVADYVYARYDSVQQARASKV